MKNSRNGVLKVTLVQCLKVLKGALQNWSDTTSWGSQIYIKLTRSNDDDDSRKHPLKYFCMKCHIWWEINNWISHLEFIAQWAFHSFFCLHQSHAKCVLWVFHYFLVTPDGRSIPNFYRFVSLCSGGLHSVFYTASKCFVSKNQFCNVPLINAC